MRENPRSIYGQHQPAFWHLVTKHFTTNTPKTTKVTNIADGRAIIKAVAKGTSPIFLSYPTVYSTNLIPASLIANSQIGQGLANLGQLFLSYRSTLIL